MANHFEVDSSQERKKIRDVLRAKMVRLIKKSKKKASSLGSNFQSLHPTNRMWILENSSIEIDKKKFR